MLLGGLRELTATTVEDGGRIRDNTEIAVHASIALLGPARAARLPEFKVLVAFQRMVPLSSGRWLGFVTVP